MEVFRIPTIDGHTLGVQLAADLSGGDTLTGAISFDGESYVVSAVRSTFSKSNPASSYAGAYTIEFSSRRRSRQPPRKGNCWATASIGATAR